MNGVHRKTSISRTTDFILALHGRGEGLLWERYEQQLPLCAFTDNGLNCRKCFHGPCRINPFGDEPSHGVCGADRDQIVMENVFEATLRGVLDTTRSFSLLCGSAAANEIPDFSSNLHPEIQSRLLKKGLLPVKKHQLFEVQNSFFSHKGYLSRTLTDLMRLGLIHYGCLKGMADSISKGSNDQQSFNSGGANILIAGQVVPDLIQELRNQVEQGSRNRKVNLSTDGLTLMPSLHTVTNHGTPEFLLAMDLDALIVAPSASFPGLGILAKRLELPVILVDETKSLAQIASEAIDWAIRHRQKASYLTEQKMTPSPCSQTNGDLLFSKGKQLRKALDSGQIQGIVTILGEPNVKQTFFERTLTLLENCLKHRILVFLGGGLEVQRDLLEEELTRRTGEEFGSRTKALEADGLSPLNYFGSYCEIPKVVNLLKDVTSGKELSKFPTVVTFPEFSKASAWATAVSFLSLGFTVQIGTRLPFWGSPSLMEILLKEWPEISGGKLLTAPSPPDAQLQAQEVISLMEARKL
jgi:hypothetical protein